MSDILTRTVAQIAAGSMTAVRVFEKYAIEYGCKGQAPLAEACREKGLDPDAVARELTAGGSAGREFIEAELPRIAVRLEKVARGHGDSDPALQELVPVFQRLRAEIAGGEAVATTLESMRRLTANYAIPPQACNGYRALLNGMRDVDEALSR